MRPKNLLARYWHWLGFTVFSALIAFVALVAPTRVSLLELEREAFAAQDRIRAELMADPHAVLQALTVPGAAPHLNEIFRNAGYAPRILRYELYNPRGHLVFTSGLANLPLNKNSVGAAVSPTIDGGTVGLHRGRRDNGPSHFALLHTPINFYGDTQGALDVYLDQSEQATVLSSYFGVIALVTLVLLGTGVATPLAMAWICGQQQRQAREEVRYLQSHDALTGLVNRRSFTDRLTHIFERMKQDNTHVAIICVDIDRFQDINESLEHGGGDGVLHEVGSRIRGSLRDRDIVARLGGDEFAIALVDVGTLSDVMSFMDRLAAALRKPFPVSDREVLITVSVGIALAPADGDTPDEALRHATIALSRAQGDGGQRMCFFEESMDRALQHRHTIEQDLRLALRRGEFEVVYQPQFNLKSEMPCGSEALVRWHHPVHGNISPGHFISVAEETGLIVPIGEWVLRRACFDAANWPAHLTVAVNLSPAQFRDGDIAETVADVLHETGLPAERLELEITESLLINDTEEVVCKLNRLRELGVRIAMDDFGTGYSSLSYLARFPFSKVKIDRQFIRNMTRDPAMRAIVKTIIALGKSLNVTVTAEGVETREQAQMLRRFGCPEVQGFLYGRPQTAAQHAELAQAASSDAMPLGHRSSAA